MRRLLDLARSEWLAVRVQIALGLVFLVAAWPKLLEPPVFAKNVWAYDLLPGVLVNLAALFLPGLEICLGLALVLGLWRDAAALVAAGLCIAFFLALGWNVLAGNPVNCSCFELNPSPKSCAELLAGMKREMLLDLLLLALAAHTLWVVRARRREAAVATAPR